jgi:hypothetical protein
VRVPVRRSIVVRLGARVAQRLPDGLRRFADGRQVRQTLQLERRVGLLTEAVQENAALAVGLERRVSLIESHLVAALEAREDGSGRRGSRDAADRAGHRRDR